MTAVDRVDCERIDHQGFVPEIYAGLFLTALYLMQLGPNMPNINDLLEDWLSLTLLAGATLGLVGVGLGTKLIFSRIRRRVSYIVGLFGIPLMIFPLAWYTYASVEVNDLVVTALGGGLGLAIEIGLVRMFVDLVQDITADHSGHGHD